MNVTIIEYSNCVILVVSMHQRGAERCGGSMNRRLI